MIALLMILKNRLPKSPAGLLLSLMPVLAIVTGITSLISCSGTSHEKKYRIGFAQCTGTENWKKTMREGMQRELSFHPGTELIYRSAVDNSDLQVKQIKEVLGPNIDILLAYPNEARP